MKSSGANYPSAGHLPKAALAILPIVAAAAGGSWVTSRNLTDWYAGLSKPSFNPPDWIFGPAWTGLYLLMAYAVWRVLQTPSRNPSRKAALALYFTQLALNALWSWLFFGLNSPLAGLLDIVPQWLLILATLYSFSRMDVVAAFCLVPLAGWVGFATYLNWTILQLNS